MSYANWAWRTAAIPGLDRLPKDWRIEPLREVLSEYSDKNVAGAEENLLSLSYGRIVRRDIESNEGLLPESFTTYQIVQPSNIILRLTDLQNDKRSLRVGYVLEKGIITSAYVCLRVLPGCDPRYLYYVLHAYDLMKIFYGLGGGVRQSMDYDDIKWLPLPIPPLDIQLSIVAGLDTVESKSEEARKHCSGFAKMLEERRIALISTTVTKGCDALAPTRETGIEWIREIPAHWKLEKIKALFKLCCTPAPPDNDYELLSLYTDVGVRPRKELQERGNKATTTDGYWLVKPGDIVVNKLLAWMGAIAASSYEGVTSPAYDILRPRVELNPWYYDYLFRSGLYLTAFRMNSRGIMDMRLRLYFEELGTIIVPYPPIDEQNAIVEYLRPRAAFYENALTLCKCYADVVHEHSAAVTKGAVLGQTALRSASSLSA
ncbi:MAG: restriction endonuclease subunit S [Candidatus Cybelea sp.]